MEKWFIKNKLADFKKISEELSVSEVLVRLMVNRGLTTAEEMKNFMEPKVENMHSPYMMKDMAKAAQIVKNKVLEQVHIRIVGDYDVDGVISTFILYKTLQRAGANVDYEIPDRIDDGYGINISIIQAAIDDNVDTIITCDNGIAAIEQIKYAKENGVTVVVLDHHDIVFELDGDEKRYILPDADAVVNPHQKDCEYPYEFICAGQVAYKFAKVFYDIFTYTQVGDKIVTMNKADMKEYLSMAAIATVCDVMPLCDENRIFVSEGLKMINAQPNTGLRALINVCNLDEVKSYHLGFVIGPCINASGRLESAKLALKLFLLDDYSKAVEYAEKLKHINEERKEMTVRAIEVADTVIDMDETGNPKDKVLVLYLEDCHESIAGIVAGRIKEKYNRPAIVITKGKGVCKGSARSIEEYNMFEEMSKVRHLFEKFGGHPMAAGLSIKEENIAKLRMELNNRSKLTENDLMRKCSIDIELPISLLNYKIIDELDILQPFGKDNDKPSFVERDLSVLKISIIGKNKNVLKIRLRNKYNAIMDGMYFGDMTDILSYMEDKYGMEEMDKAMKGLTNNIKLTVIYYPQINEYMGNKSINIVISHYR